MFVSFWRSGLQAGLFAEAGVSKIRLTGGEPTLKRDIENLVSSLAALPGITDVGLTSNGIALPRKLASLQSAGELPSLCSPTDPSSMVACYLS